MKIKFNDFVRSFGMSGFLVTEELKDVEKKFNVELGHIMKSDSNSTDYYPQFEKEVRQEASIMANYYEVFYCLEKSIRKLISDTLYESKGTLWWQSGLIPKEIVKAVNDRITKETDSGVSIRSEYPIDYTTFGELSVIITSNWEIFQTILTSQRAVERVMNNLNILRGPIAHCCPISEDETDRLKLAVKDWFRMIG